jgi:hypothetical protein
VGIVLKLMMIYMVRRVNSRIGGKMVFVGCLIVWFQASYSDIRKEELQKGLGTPLVLHVNGALKCIRILDNMFRI